MKYLIWILFALVFLLGLSGWVGVNAVTDLSQRVTLASDRDESRAQSAQRASRGSQYQRCILYRESRSQNLPPNGSNASGYYQFTPVAWDATVKRMGKGEWAGRHAYTFSRAIQDRVYHAAWRQGNGRFYWSARWGADYACFPNDTEAMR